MKLEHGLHMVMNLVEMGTQTAPLIKQTALVNIVVSVSRPFNSFLLRAHLVVKV